MSLSPISFSNPRVHFRGEGVDLGAPGKYSNTTTQPEGDKTDFSEKAAEVADEPKKGGIGKTIGKIAGAVVVLLGASYGMFRWKGDKWLLPEAKGFFAYCKKAIVKPGQFIEEKIISKLAGKGSKKAAGKANEAAEAAEDAVAQAANTANDAARQAAEETAETVAK